MGIISIEKANELYWLGRYTERVFTTLQVFNSIYDKMIDQDTFAYDEFCMRLTIPNIYVSQEDFIKRYLFDEKNTDSLISNLYRAYDNAILHREDISSEVLAYIHMSLDVLKASRDSDTPLWSLMPLTDYIFAFWGSAEDYIEEEIRHILKAGKLVERLDLYLRLGMSKELIQKECCRLKFRVHQLQMEYNEEALQSLETIILKEESWEQDIPHALFTLGSILEIL